MLSTYEVIIPSLIHQLVSECRKDPNISFGLFLLAIAPLLITLLLITLLITWTETKELLQLKVRLLWGAHIMGCHIGQYYIATNIYS